MNSVLKKISSKLPKRFQQELKRLHYWYQIRINNFLGDEPEYDQLETWVKQGDWVIDVGANIGHYAFKFSRLVGEEGRVFAFEPVIDTFELLVANVTKFPHRNVTLFNVAASESEMVVGMELPKLDSGLDNYYMAHISDTDASVKVYCVPIDSFSFFKPIKFVKIDVEGHELSTLKGMKKLILRDHPIIVAEGHTDDVVSFLSDLGYSNRRFEKSPNTFYEYRHGSPTGESPI